MTHAYVVHIDDRIEGAVYIGRAMPRRGVKGSFFANPFKITTERDRMTCLALFKDHLTPFHYRRLPELRGKPLACWCRHAGEPMTAENACHGDVLIALLERFTDDELRELADDLPRSNGNAGKER